MIKAQVLRDADTDAAFDAASLSDAALDLLAALKASRHIISECIRLQYNTASWGLPARLAAIDAAIAKARKAGVRP